MILNKDLKINKKKDNLKIKLDCDNEINNDKVIKKNIGGRPKKAEMYKKERKELLNKLNNILGVTETNKKFYLYDIDNNVDIQKSILEMKDDVKKYFSVRQYGIFVNEDMNRGYMSLIRAIYKESGIEWITSNRTIERNGNKINTSGYFLQN